MHVYVKTFKGKKFVCVFQVVNGGCLTYSFWPSPLFKSVFGVFLVVVEFLLPLAILIYCYGRIIWVLTRRVSDGVGPVKVISLSRSRSIPTSAPKPQKDTFRLARDNTLKTFILVGVCFIICLSNSQVYYLLFNLGFDTDFDGTYFKFAILLSFINCTINPFIYLVKYKDYKLALRHCFVTGKDKSNEGSESLPSVLQSSDISQKNP